MTDLVSRVAAAIGQAQAQVDEDDVRNRNTRQGDEGRFGFASPTTVALERMSAQRRALLGGLEKIADMHQPEQVFEWQPDDLICGECSRNLEWVRPPCPTLLAVAEALGCSTEGDQ